MFDLEHTSPFFEKFSSEHPSVVQNIDVMRENILLLNENYHHPKRFILHLNNVLRSLLFFMEFSVKNSPTWLHDAVDHFKADNFSDYEILKYLRNVSAHQNLVVPDEAIVGGLYRIRSEGEYVLKLGLGDTTKPRKYPLHIALKDTEDLFQDMLVFSSMVFMDLAHSSLYECLGLTRRWFFRVKFESKASTYDEVVDIYQRASDFTIGLMDSVCKAYADASGGQFEHTFRINRAEFNNVNTLLEIDLFPSLFSIWWEKTISPLSFSVQSKIAAGNSYVKGDKLYKWIFEGLTSSVEEYRELLTRFRDLDAASLMSKEHAPDFVRFTTANHWHHKKAFSGVDPLKCSITPSDVLWIQRLSGAFLDETRKGKQGMIQAAKDSMDKHFDKLLKSIELL